MIFQKLKRLFRPWTFNRRMFWTATFLAPLIGSNYRCRLCGQHLGRGFVWLWKGKIRFFSRHRTRVRYSPEGPFVVAFECVGGCSQKSHLSLIESCLPVPAIHIILGHQDQDYLAAYVLHHKALQPSAGHLLVYGGPLESVPKIPGVRVIFCDDQRLRGRTMDQSYTNVFCEAYQIAMEIPEYKDVRYIFFTEADHWALQKDYLSVVAHSLTSCNAGFGAVGLDRVNCTNDTHLHRSRTEGNLDACLTSLYGGKPLDFWHCLGTGIILSKKAFESFALHNHMEQGCYLEVYLPSMLCAMGFTGVNLKQITRLMDNVRFSPEFSQTEALRLAVDGCAFVHPLKTPISTTN